MAEQDPRIDRLHELMDELTRERQKHVEALERIDETLDRYGITPEGTPAPPRRRQPTRRSDVVKRREKGPEAKARPAPGPRGRRRRGSFEQTGEQFVLSLLEKRGEMTTSDIHNAWIKAGRGGRPDNMLSKLTRENRIKRESIPGARGSQYRLA
ncbi:MAG: hypothetical protein ACLFV3_06510 [Phycisphaeraceae bacterium]